MSSEELGGEPERRSGGRSGPEVQWPVGLTVQVDERTAEWLREYADAKGVKVAQAHRWALSRGIGALAADWYLEIEREQELSRLDR